MCERYDVKVRGILDGRKRDVREIEILGRSLRWTEEGLEYEASDKRRQALLEGLGLSEELKKPEKIGQAEDLEMLEEAENTRFRSLAATLKLHVSGQVGRGICRKGDMHEDGEPDTRKLEKVEEGMQILVGSGGGDVGDAGVGNTTV